MGVKPSKTNNEGKKEKPTIIKLHGTEKRNKKKSLKKEKK